MLEFKSYEDFVQILKNKKFEKRLEDLSRKYSAKKVLLYGAGTFFSALNDNYDLKKLSPIGIADRKFYETEGEEAGYKAINPYDIPEFSPDVILLCTFYTHNTTDFLKEEILSENKNIQIEPIYKKGFFENLKDMIMED